MIAGYTVIRWGVPINPCGGPETLTPSICFHLDLNIVKWTYEICFYRLNKQNWILEVKLCSYSGKLDFTLH